MGNRVCTEVPYDEIEIQKNYAELVKKKFILGEKGFFIQTFGCQMNENDSEKLSGLLQTMGYHQVGNPEESDLIIFNTCCVRQNAELKVYGHLGALRKLKKQNSELIIAVCGCMMQQAEVVEHIKKKYTHVDIVFGTGSIYRLPEMLNEVLQKGIRHIEYIEAAGLIAKEQPIARKEKIKAWVTIMHGCDNFCSYCIVPYVRGREHSRDPGDILEELRQLSTEGCKEVTLLGQNVNSYGKDLTVASSFPKLMQLLNDSGGIERIRFMTSHPKDINDQLIEVMSKGDKICEYLHLPVQSGSTRLLSVMNRRYSKEHYIERIATIRKAIPGISITTDIIVGFPGETEEDFSETLDLLKKIRFDSAYTFLYSQRSGTPAAEMQEQIDEKTKKMRFSRLVDLQNKISMEINEKHLGGIFEVLVEGMSKNNRNTYTGRTRTNKIVNFEGTDDLIGKLVNVKIEKIQTWSLLGKVQ